MKTTINQLMILDRAKTMVLKGYNLNDSLTTSSMIELLQLKMMNGVSHFLYRKKDGVHYLKKLSSIISMDMENQKDTIIVKLILMLKTNLLEVLGMRT